MEIKSKILIVYERNKYISALKRQLHKFGYEVIYTRTGAEALQIAQSHCPDVIFLGSKLKDMNGTDVLRNIRRWCEVPVIMVSDAVRMEDMLDSLESGADDHIVLPCSADQFMLRMSVVLRRHAAAQSGFADQDSFRVGELVVDYARFRAFVSGRDAGLTHNEFRLLSLLSRNAGSICTYEYLLSQIWGPNSSEDNQILRVNMSNIRKKLEKGESSPHYISTISGIGYRMNEK